MLGPVLRRCSLFRRIVQTGQAGTDRAATILLVLCLLSLLVAPGSAVASPAAQSEQEHSEQPAYHTALDAPGGFAEGGVIKALETRVRYFPELNRVRLHEFVLLDVSTASPWRRPFRPVGWHLDLGRRTRLFASKGHGLETAGIFRAQGGMGAALAPARGLHIYGFGELVLEAAPDIRGKISIGPILRSGFSYTTPEGLYTLHAEGIAGVLTGPYSDPWFKAQINQRVSISKNWSAVLNTSYERAYGVGFFEARLGLVRYF